MALQRGAKGPFPAGLAQRRAFQLATNQIRFPLLEKNPHRDANTRARRCVHRTAKTLPRDTHLWGAQLGSGCISAEFTPALVTDMTGASCLRHVYSA